MNELSISSMYEKDIDEVLAISERSFIEAWPRAAFEGELDREVTRALVVREASGRLLGYCIYWWVAGEVHLVTIATHPEHRKKGIGELLVKTMLERSKDEGEFLAAHLDVRAGNEAAILLYLKLGFEIRDRRPRYYSDGEDALQMTLEPKES